MPNEIDVTYTFERVGIEACFGEMSDEQWGELYDKTDWTELLADMVGGGDYYELIDRAISRHTHRYKAKMHKEVRSRSMTITAYEPESLEHKKQGLIKNGWQEK